MEKPGPEDKRAIKQSGKRRKAQQKGPDCPLFLGKSELELTKDQKRSIMRPRTKKYEYKGSGGSQAFSKEDMV